jgi:hypothetical protein
MCIKGQGLGSQEARGQAAVGGKNQKGFKAEVMFKVAPERQEGVHWMDRVGVFQM